ncbi:hypothetical protein MASR2M70_03550 [Bacillota bacterium]
MKLYLQFGHGMKALTLYLAKKWGGVSAILSPRDMTTDQLDNWSKEFNRNGVNCYFDPQCYCPKSQLKRLSQYSFWDCNLNTNMQLEGNHIDKRIKEIKRYNDIANTKAYILPSILHDYDSSWGRTFIFQSKRFIDSAHRIMNDKPVFMTLMLPKDFLTQNEAIIEPVLQEILELDVDGYYVIAEALEKKYLVDNPLWLSNVLQICAALKIAGKEVIFGYGNHQLLPLALLKVDAMASGTWLNVRSFTNRFVDTEDQKRKSTWIYYPESLSEYKLSFLDWAFNNGYLNTMKSNDKGYLNESINKIYQASVQPSATGFNETDAFKHYLSSLKYQINNLKKPSYKEALLSYEMLLTTAEREIERLEKGGVYAQARSFRDVIDVNRAAVAHLDRTLGFSLNMNWETM